MKLIFSVYIWFVYGTSFLLSFICSVPVFLVTYPFDRFRKAVNAVFMFFGKSIVIMSPGWKVKKIGFDKFDRSKPTVFMGNHRSFLDMPLLACLPWNMAWVSKDSLFKIPVAGWNMTMAGHISVKRGKTSALRDVRKAIPYVENGVPVMLYPEGTRSKSGKLQPFKKGSFLLAHEKGYTVQPVIVRNTRETMQPGSWQASPTANLEIELLDSIDASLYEKVEDLMAATYRSMATALGEEESLAAAT